MDKDQLRHIFKEERCRLLESGLTQDFSRKISGHLSAWITANLAPGRCIFAFIALPGEADLSALYINENIQSQYQLAFPTISKNFQMDFYRAPQASLWQNPDKWMEKNAFGGWQPRANPADKMLPRPGDLMLVPSLAVDRHGTRLGFGKGYYDRYLSKCRDLPLLVAPNYSSCFTDEPLPKEVWDVTVQAVVTELGWTDTTPIHYTPTQKP